MEEPIRLSIRELSEFLLQSGSIDNRFGGADRAAEGGRIHRKLQKSAGPGYEAEVFLKSELTYLGTRYLLEGRADGVFTRGNLLVVDEIKTVSRPLEIIDEDFNRAHWGQAYCYAYILTETRGLESAGIRLTYCQADTEEIKYFYREISAAELKAFVFQLLEGYRKWARYKSDWQLCRDESIRALPFPFPEYRKGQRDMAAAVYRCIKQNWRLFCQAPTGIGKTVSALFPSVKAMGEGISERIFYLTAKTITRQAAQDAFDLLRQKGLRMKTVTLTAKDKICFLEKRDCNPEACPYAQGYYDRVRDEIFSMLSAGDCFTREIIEKTARERRLCPFELSLDLSLWCDGIICDYNYLFDPIASLQRFFGDRRGEYVFLIDEAHNLVDRARDMYSAELKKSGFYSLKKALGKGGGELGRSLRELNARFIEARKSCGETDFLVTADPEELFCRAVTRFSTAASAWLEEYKTPSPLREKVLEQFFESSFFLRILELFDTHYRAFVSAREGDTSVKLLCLDPSALLDERLSKGRSATLFSATLSPVDYYREVLGGGAQAKRILLPSPFPRENLCLLSAVYVSTKYRDRPASLSPIARLLYRMISAKQGNYLAYFPSYRYLQDVYQAFRELYPQIKTLLQTGEMDETAREQFLQEFDGKRKETMLGFCVLGGIFAEGVDLKGDRLIGTAVIGVGLPQIGPELELLKTYYNEKSGCGYEYAYRYPGMNKVLQAAGRVIRGPDDRGVVLLIDSRFPTRDYQRLFPPHWSHWQEIRSEGQITEKLSAFWGVD